MSVFTRSPKFLTWCLCVGAIVAVSFRFSASAASWSTNGSLVNGRFNHTATLLPDGKVLVAGGQTNSVDQASTELYDAATGKWSAGPNMTTNRELHSATLLQNGKVLVVGGYVMQGFNQGTLATAELYDPVSGTWTPTGSLAGDRALHTATLLPNGKVLVAGGFHYDPATFSGTNLATAELYDPVGGTWTTVASMSIGRQYHTATLLQNGKVLVVAGRFTNYLASAELYDPTAGMWSPAGSLPSARSEHCATLLRNGKVLVAGGINSVPTNGAALYDPVLNSWSIANAMSAKRDNFCLGLLPNGKVLACGGAFGTTIYSSAEIYDPAVGGWTPAASMNFKRAGATCTILANGGVLLSAGYDLSGFDSIPVSASEVFDSSTESWTTASSMQAPRYYHSVTPLANGRILVAGGVSWDNFVTNGAEIFDPANSSFTATGSMLAPHYGHSTILLPSGKVLLIDSGTNNTAAELYDPQTGVWTAAGPGFNLNAANGLVLLRDGRVMVCAFTNTFLYNYSSNTWTQAPPPLQVRFGATASLLTNGLVLLAGGRISIPLNPNSDTLIFQAELFNPQTASWSTVGSLTYGRYNHTANLLPNGKVLVSAGYGTSTNFPDSRTQLPYAEIFNPVSGTWTTTVSLAIARESHASASLLNGQVFIAGGTIFRGGFLSSATYTNGVEIFDPNTEKWRLASSLPFSPTIPKATLLPTGKAIIAGGITNAGLGFAATNQPAITTYPNNVATGAGAVITGTQFRGRSEASSGKSDNSPGDHPVFQLRALASDWTAQLRATAWTSNSCNIFMPTNFPIGNAFLTVFVSGVNSTSAIVNIGAGGMTLPFQLVNPVRLPNGTFRFNFTNSPGLAFTAIASTNIGTPQSNWVNLGAVTEISPGQFQFIDPGAPTNSRRFYRVKGN